MDTLPIIERVGVQRERDKDITMADSCVSKIANRPKSTCGPDLCKMKQRLDL